MSKLKNKLLPLFLLFFVFPAVISLILVFYFGEILNYGIIKQIISVSGYGFSLSSLILVFILFRSFKPSDYQKTVSEQKYLDEDAIKELGPSLENIKSCISNNEVKGLEASSSAVLHIYRSLTDHKDDAVLKAYSNKLKKLSNLINKHKLPTIGITNDLGEFKRISDKNRSDIWMAADDLKKYSERL